MTNRPDPVVAVAAGITILLLAVTLGFMPASMVYDETGTLAYAVAAPLVMLGSIATFLAVSYALGALWLHRERYADRVLSWVIR